MTLNAKWWCPAIAPSHEPPLLPQHQFAGLPGAPRGMRGEIVNRGGKKTSLRIARALFAALIDPAGVTAQRLGALERVQLLLEDWQHTKRRLADTEARMTGVLDQLELTELGTSIPGMSEVGVTAILAETGDPRRFTTAPAMVKHAGLAPREKLSGTFVGRTKLTGPGPSAASADGRVANSVGAQKANPIYVAGYRHLITREQNELTATQAQTVIAAAILRQLHAVLTTGRAWDPDTATHGTRNRRQALVAA